jgi:proton glutamate symport protein
MKLRLPKISLTWKIMIGLVLGILLGYLSPKLGADVRPLSLLFLNLIKAIIAPLIFSTLVIGIAGTGDIKQVGRIGIKSLFYFEIVTTFALFIGLAAVNITKPGVGVSLAGITRPEDKAVLAARAADLSAQAQEAAKRAADYAAQAQSGANTPGGNGSEAASLAAAEAASAAQKSSDAAQAVAKGLTAPDPPAKPQSFGDLIQHLSPTSIIKAMAEGDVLQIVVFSVLFALAVASIGSKAAAVVKWCESLADIMFRFTEFVMKFAPIGVGAAMANTVSHSGLKVLQNLSILVGTLYGALAVFVLCVLLPIALIFRVPLKDFFRAVRTPATIAFATTSSESALPRAMENMSRLGVPRRIVGFVLPTGYSFNLDGTTVYLSLASVFVAQAAGVHLSWWQQITMVFTLMLTSKGVAGVPRAALVILMGTVNSLGLPAEGVIIILGVDELMDMGRTALNVVGNCMATVVVARWEGAFRAAEWKAEEKELEAVTGEKALSGAD